MDNKKKKNISIKLKRFLVMLIVFVMIAGTIAGAAIPAFAASDQTTIIMFDKVKSTYDIGEKVKVTVGISSTDGSYLQSANVGFGYNGATMKLLTETDSPDHFTVSAASPQKWLYYSMEFEMIANGKMFFIAGAYSGDGVIVARRADGSRIELPRASVMFKVGTGIYTRTSDLNLKSVNITDKETGNEIKFNRSFDENITEYYGEVDATVDELDIKAEVQEPSDKIVMPDTKLKPGDNAVKVGVKAVDGTVKEYTFNIYKPEQVALVNNIKLTDDKGNEIQYKFNQETLSYEININSDVNSIKFEAEAGNEWTKFEYPVVDKIDAGYNIKKVRAYTATDEKEYEFNIFRELSSLSLSSLVVEASDETAPEMDKPFDPETYEYKVQVRPDVSSVKLIYTLGNSGDMVKEESNEYELQPGTNTCTVTVTDGVNEKVYTVVVEREAYEKVEIEETTPAAPKPIVPKDYTEFKMADLRAFFIGGIIVLVAILGVVAAKVFKSNAQYNKTEEAAAEKEEKDRKKRLKEKEKQRKKEEQERNKF